MNISKQLLKIAKDLISEEKKKTPKNSARTNAEFLEWLKKNLNSQEATTIREIWQKKFSE